MYPCILFHVAVMLGHWVTFCRAFMSQCVTSRCRVTVRLPIPIINKNCENTHKWTHKQPQPIPMAIVEDKKICCSDLGFPLSRDTSRPFVSDIPLPPYYGHQKPEDKGQSQARHPP